jgi:hypothetical protein
LAKTKFGGWSNREQMFSVSPCHPCPPPTQSELQRPLPPQPIHTQDTYTHSSNAGNHTHALVYRHIHVRTHIDTHMHKLTRALEWQPQVCVYTHSTHTLTHVHNTHTHTHTLTHTHTHSYTHSRTQTSMYTCAHAMFIKCSLFIFVIHDARKCTTCKQQVSRV